MRSRVIVAAILLVSALAAGVLASGDRAGSGRQWAVVYLTEPTLIGSMIVEGPVLFIHDDRKMARGEPCTTVQLFDPATAPLDEVASFHCIPTPRDVARKFTIRTQPNAALGFGCVLTEYQFAGDAESHGVPAPALGH
jgi:hypothetical protein